MPRPSEAGRSDENDPTRTLASQNIALHSRPLSPLSRPPLNVATGVIPFTTPGAVLSVVGGLHERVHSSRRLRDGMAVR